MRDIYISPFASRYSSDEMLYNFSDHKKHTIWRQLWIALASAEQSLGLPITDSQIAEMQYNLHNIDYDAVRAYETELKHDVMAHIMAYGDQCPTARPIIHLGATSAYVVDNADLVIIKEAISIIKKKLIHVLRSIIDVADEWVYEPTVAFTHFQPAQFTTVGKRMCLWANDLLMDLDELEFRERNLAFLGAKGATGTQASFLTLFDGDTSKVDALEREIAKRMGFDKIYHISGQTYSRKVDAQIHATLAGIAESAHKFANDMRLLQHLGEIREPFGSKQVGSSAMAYKRNPVKSERITSLARLVISLSSNSAFTAACQWFERTLDDSAGKRIALPEAFLAVDGILMLYHSIIDGIDINVDRIRNNVQRELPFIASEDILMEAVKSGGDRQELHERIRTHATNANGHEFMERIAKDEAFAKVKHIMKNIADPMNYTGCAAHQARKFLNDVAERLKQYSDLPKPNYKIFA
ncbi:MAG: adenylosuccinate lyase [Nitrososphaerales archaeon]